jgi:GT2 family glycosyltransferase
MTVTPPVTVLVPVHGAAADVARCLDSVLRHAATTEIPFELLVVDDASHDPDVDAVLARVAAGAGGRVACTVARNEQNAGFVATVNRGLRAARGDVVVLNSDTVVTEGWLDRLADAAAAPDVATVTPLTNFGSICTLPDSIVAAFALDGPEPRIDECAAFVASSSLGLRPEVITGVGFCLYVTRDALDVVGLLDEETFGQGYGEEVDFCLRATQLGLRHLVEDGTFVYHRGAASFGDARAERIARASAVLRERYPYFRAANARERSEAPLRVAFRALELARAERDERRPHVLHLLHNSPAELGGTEKHLRALLDALLGEFDFSVLYPSDSGFVVRTLWNVGGDTPAEQELLLGATPPDAGRLHDPLAAGALTMAIDLLGIDAVHVQNLIGHSLAPLAVLARFPGPVVCSVRDLYLACPNHWLLYRNEEPCGIPDDLSLCAACLPETRGLPPGYLEEFRAAVAAGLDAVDTWVFASRSAADHMLRAYDVDPARVDVIEHGAIIDPEDFDRTVDTELVLSEPLRVAFVGMGWAKKGLRVVNALADAFAGTAVEIHHFGTPKEQASPHLFVHGPYDNEVLPHLLRRAGIQVVLLPGPYAETFGHVMTEALVAGLPVIGSRHGALAERIAARRVGWTVDPNDPSDARALIEHLDRCRDELLLATHRAAGAALHTVADTAARYAAHYRTPRRAATLPSVEERA